MTRPATDAPLTWNVSGLLGDDPGTSREYDVADVTIPLDEGMSLAGPINGHVRFQRTNRGILADARLTTALQAECSRCLRPMEVPVDISIEEEFLPALDLATGKPLSTDAEPDVARLTDHHELDLEPLVRDELVIAEPIAPLHSPDCQGLCVECGLPLDEGTHDHPTDDIDPRLEALRDFKPDESTD
jgi:DUF177 domain-containing protein